MKAILHKTAPCVAVAVLLLLSSCKNEQPAPVPPARRSTLCILDINVWSGLNYKGSLTMGEYETAAVRKKRYRALVAQIRKWSPDIVGIQEANKLPDYVDALARDTGYDAFSHIGVSGVRLGKVGIPWNLREGDALLTKPDLHAQFAGRKQLSGGHVGSFFSFHFEDATQLVAVRFRNRNQEWYAFVTHWHATPLETDEIREILAQKRGDTGTEADIAKWKEIVEKGAEWRMSECEATLDFIRATAGEHPFLLMGDFNATDALPEIAKLRQSGMVDTYQRANPDSAGLTWDSERNLNFKTYYLPEHAAEEDGTLLTRLKHLHQASPKRIDYIFLGPASRLEPLGIVVRSSRVVMDEVIEGVHASDHFGVLTEISVK